MSAYLTLSPYDGMLMSSWIEGGSMIMSRVYEYEYGILEYGITNLPYCIFTLYFTEIRLKYAVVG